MSDKRRTETPAKGQTISPPGVVSFGYNSPYADDEHIVRHSLTSEEGLPVVDPEQISADAEALRAERVASGVEDKYEEPFAQTAEELERDARLEADVEANTGT